MYLRDYDPKDRILKVKMYGNSYDVNIRQELRVVSPTDHYAETTISFDIELPFIPFEGLEIKNQNTNFEVYISSNAKIQWLIDQEGFFIEIDPIYFKTVEELREYADKMTALGWID